jgi:Hemopexin
MWNQIDSCLVWPNGKAYILSGTEYVRYDIQKDQVDSGYPKPIAGNWPGLWTPAGAGIVWPNGKAYFLRGTEYVRYDIIRYDIGQDRQDAGYPQPIAVNWHGLPSVINAATVWPNGKAYFFFGKQYARYDIQKDRVDDGYPAQIAGNWPGIPIASPEPQPPPH